MATTVQVLEVLVASPGDVRAQRTVVQTEVEGWNRGALARRLGVRLEARLWELDSVPELGNGDAQEVLNRQLLDHADIVIALFHARLGTPTQRAESGTAEELQGAIERRLPVHVFVSKADISRNHDPVQLQALNEFLDKLGRTGGLIGEFESDDELALKVRRALEADVDHHLKREAAERATKPVDSPASVAPLVAAHAQRTNWRDRLNAAADIVLGLDALSLAGPFDASPEALPEIFEQRRAEILGATSGLLSDAIESVRSGDADVPRVISELVPTLAPNPRQSGSTALLNLLRAPGCLLFHTVGVTACVDRNDLLTGEMLTERIIVDDPINGERPAVASLRESLVYPTGWPSRSLHDFLVPTVAEGVGARRADEAWERWMYLVAVANTWLGSTLSGVGAGHPYIRVMGKHNGRLESPVGKAIRREVQSAGNGSPLLAGGLCDQNASIFDSAAETFDSGFGAWADSEDWAGLPGGGGFLPSGPHYPGERPR